MHSLRTSVNVIAGISSSFSQRRGLKVPIKLREFSPFCAELSKEHSSSTAALDTVDEGFAASSGLYPKPDKSGVGFASKKSQHIWRMIQILHSYEYSGDASSSINFSTDSPSAQKDLIAATSINDSLSRVLKKMGGKMNKYDTLKVFRQLSDNQLATMFFKWVQKQPFVVIDTYVCNQLLLLLSQDKEAAWTLEVVKEMKKSGIRPDVFTITNAITCLGKCNMIHEVESMWKDMQEHGIVPDIIAYGSLMDAYSRAGLHSKVIETYKQIAKDGLRPNQCINTMLMKSYCMAGDLESALRLVKQMMASHSQLDIVSWTAIIDILGKAGRTAEALQMFKNVVTLGLKPDVPVYNAILEICGREEMFAEAESVVELMLHSGLQPTAITHKIMVTNLGRAKQPGKAALWFNQMLKNGLAPSEDCFAALLYAFIHSEMYSEAEVVLSSMKKRGVQPSTRTYIVLLSSCTDCDDRQAVELLLELMQQTGHPAHRILTLIMADSPENSSSAWEEVKQTWAGLTGTSFDDKKAIINCLVGFTAKFKHRAAAMELWSALRSERMISLVFTQSLWRLDLHDLSKGTAEMVVCHELARLKRLALERGSQEVPRVAEIVTGWGRRSRVSGVSPVKTAVLCLLNDMRSPFREKEGNVGCMAARGADLWAWFEASYL